MGIIPSMVNFLGCDHNPGAVEENVLIFSRCADVFKGKGSLCLQFVFQWMAVTKCALGPKHIKQMQTI